MSIGRCFYSVTFVFILCLSTAAQQNEKRVKVNVCKQNKNIKLQAINDAENKYRIGRIEISGNILLYDREIRQQIVSKEGDIFTQNSLDKTIENFNKWGV